jgi:hypothetical protein
MRFLRALVFLVPVGVVFAIAGILPFGEQVGNNPASVLCLAFGFGLLVFSVLSLIRPVGRSAPALARAPAPEVAAQVEGALLEPKLPQCLPGRKTDQRGPSEGSYASLTVRAPVQHHENAKLATALIDQATKQQQITPKTLTLHADRGAPMRANLLEDLGVAKSHSRPYTSSDNPYFRRRDPPPVPPNASSRNSKPSGTLSASNPPG